MQYSHLKNITILYCEDEIDLREITADMLSQYTKKVHLAKDGLEGLEIFKKYANEIDLIITDINMPNMNGLDMAKEIKEINQNIPVIVATAFSNSSYLLEAIELGIDKYILKPIDIRKLFNVIGKSLMYHELRDLYKDTLTHLPNRNALIKDLKLRSDSTLAIFDIDDFSTINDLYGDVVGDEILINFANKISSYFSSINQISYRVGDDKFLILINDETIHEKEIEQLSKEFLNEFELNGLKVNNEIINFGVTIAIARATYVNTYNTALRVLSLAKEHYVPIITYDKSIHDTNAQDFKENHGWIQKLRDGLHNGEFQAFYQSIVDVKTKEVYKYEALIRYISKDGKVVPPYKFLPIAKKAKIFSGIVKLMINECFKFINAKSITVSLNVSFEDIKTHSTYEYIMNKLEENKDIAKYLHFELLETEEIEDFTIAKDFIDNVRSYGCQVGVDDFGAGYSNFNMLGELDLDFVKIDGSLIKQLETNKNQEIIVDTISNYTKRINVKTVAEFVSCEGIYDKIKELNIDYAQGYYFAEPVPLNKVPSHN